MGFHPIDLLRLVPVCPKSCNVHALQAPMLYRCRPGQWFQKLCGLKTNWHRESWSVRGTDRGQVMEALSKCESLTEQPCRSELPQLRRADFRVYRQSSNRFVCFFFTHQRQWLDCCELEILEAGIGDELLISAFSFSAAVVPAASPLALLPSILLFFIPFGDMGQNKLHLRALRQLLTAEGIEVLLL